MKVGVHLGHSFFYSRFFSSWMLDGWRSNMFIFDTIFSVYLFRMGLLFIKNCIRIRRPIWFINLNHYISPIVARYAYLCGESFSVYRWINGALTNFRSIVGWGSLLYDLASKGLYDFRHSDRKRLSGLIGFLFYRKRLPGTLFLPAVKDCEIAADEFASANIPTVGIVDSNVLSWTVTIPIPGNDDSFECINFYCYLVSKLIISKKMHHMFHTWDDQLTENKKRKNLRAKKIKKKNLYYFYWINKYNVNVNNIDDNLNLIIEFLKNDNIVIKRTYTEYESLFRSFVKTDMVFKWKGF